MEKTKAKKPPKKPKNVKPKPKPKPKSAQSSKPKSPKNGKPKKVKQKSIRSVGSGITILRDSDSSIIDEMYDRKIQTVIKRIKTQNELTDDKIRFGWNVGDYS